MQELSIPDIYTVIVNGYEFDVELDVDDEYDMNIIFDWSMSISKKNNSSNNYSTISALDVFLEEVNENDSASEVFHKMYSEGWRTAIVEDNKDESTYLLASIHDKGMVVNGKAKPKKMIPAVVERMNEKASSLISVPTVEQPALQDTSKVSFDLIIETKNGEKYVDEGRQIEKIYAPSIADTIAKHGITISRDNYMVSLNPSSIDIVTVKNIKDVS